MKTNRNRNTLFWVLLSVVTSIIGFNIHGSYFWAVMDFLFTPLAWVKWFIYQEVTLSIIKQSFPWFFK